MGEFHLLKNLVLLQLLCSTLIINAENNADKSTANANEQVDPVKLFLSLFKHKRSDQKEAVKGLMALNDYSKQYKMIEIIAEKASQVLEASQVTLREAGYIPGMEFPKEEKIRDALSLTIENAALMSELVLHLPNVCHRVLNAHKPWNLMLTWGIFFASQSTFLDNNTKKLIKLATQELDLAEKDPNYVNPYTSGTIGKSKEKIEESHGSQPKKKKRKSFKKGPTMSRNFGDL